MEIKGRMLWNHSFRPFDSALVKLSNVELYVLLHFCLEIGAPPTPASGVLSICFCFSFECSDWPVALTGWISSDPALISPWSHNAKLIVVFLTLVVYRVHSKKRLRLLTIFFWKEKTRHSRDLWPKFAAEGTVRCSLLRGGRCWIHSCTCSGVKPIWVTKCLLRLVRRSLSLLMAERYVKSL